MPEVACVILAAGASSRLGQPKQLVRIDGETLLKRTARLAREAGCNPIVVILGFEAERIRTELDPSDIVIVTNKEWPSGMCSSVRCGIETLSRFDPASENVLLLVCDQLALNSDVLRQLVETHIAASSLITAARYGGRSGVPAIFSSPFFPNLKIITGDCGAREILEEHADVVTYVDFPGGEDDLDTPEQLGRIRS